MKKTLFAKSSIWCLLVIKSLLKIKSKYENTTKKRKENNMP